MEESDPIEQEVDDAEISNILRQYDNVIQRHVVKGMSGLYSIHTIPITNFTKTTIENALSEVLKNEEHLPVRMMSNVGLILRNKTDNSLKFFYPRFQTSLFENPTFKIKDAEKLKKFMLKYNEEQTVKSMTNNYVNSNYELVRPVSLEVNVVPVF